MNEIHHRTRGERAHELARDMTGEELARQYPCFVNHPDAGGQCERKASVIAYGLAFCEVHGVEVKVGAHDEIFEDASDFLDRLANPYAPPLNAEVEHTLRAAVKDLSDGMPGSKEEEAALLRAYPVIPERVDEETAAFDYLNTRGATTPEEDYWQARRLLHQMMRMAHEKGFVWMVEMLEYEREHVSAQTAFALEDNNRRVGLPQS